MVWQLQWQQASQELFHLHKWLTDWPHITVFPRLTLSLEHKKHKRQHSNGKKQTWKPIRTRIEFQYLTSSRSSGFLIQYTWQFSYHRRLNKNIKDNYNKNSWNRVSEKPWSLGTHPSPAIKHSSRGAGKNLDRDHAFAAYHIFRKKVRRTTDLSVEPEGNNKEQVDQE